MNEKNSALDELKKRLEDAGKEIKFSDNYCIITLPDAEKYQEYGGNSFYQKLKTIDFELKIKLDENYNQEKVAKYLMHLGEINKISDNEEAEKLFKENFKNKIFFKNLTENFIQINYKINILEDKDDHNYKFESEMQKRNFDFKKVFEKQKNFQEFYINFFGKNYNKKDNDDKSKMEDLNEKLEQIGAKQIEKINNENNSLSFEFKKDNWDFCKKSENKYCGSSKVKFFSGKNNEQGREKQLFTINDINIEFIEEKGEVNSIKFYYLREGCKEKFVILNLQQKDLKGEDLTKNKQEILEEIQKGKTGQEIIISLPLLNDMSFYGPFEKINEFLKTNKLLDEVIPSIDTEERKITYDDVGIDILDNNYYRNLFKRDFYAINNKKEKKSVVYMKEHNVKNEEEIDDDLNKRVDFFKKIKEEIKEEIKEDEKKPYYLNDFISFNKTEKIIDNIKNHTNEYIEALINENLPKSMVDEINTKMNDSGYITAGNEESIEKKILNCIESKEMEIDESKNWLTRNFWLSQEQRRLKALKEQLNTALEAKQNEIYEENDAKNNVISNLDEKYNNQNIYDKQKKQIIKIEEINNLNCGRFSCCGL